MAKSFRASRNGDSASDSRISPSCAWERISAKLRLASIERRAKYICADARSQAQLGNEELGNALFDRGNLPVAHRRVRRQANGADAR
jgi:hypothetical protein